MSFFRRLFGKNDKLTLPAWTQEMPPEQPDDDVEYWDARWREDIERVDPNEYNADIRPLDFVWAIGSIPALRARGVESVLFVGNGIDQTPKAFAFAGFHAVALDVSPVATSFARDYALPDRELRLFFQWSLDRKSSGGDFSAEYAAPGGSVRFVTGDLLDASAEPGPFGCIIANRSLQGSRIKRMDDVADALDARLAPHGILSITIQNYSLVWKKYEEAFTKRGYTRDWEEGGRKLLSGGVGSG